VPDFLRNMLCLTVYEAKGLEFDDVILYNFFSEDQGAGKWKLLNDVEFSQHRIKRCQDFEFMDFDALDIEEEEGEEAPKEMMTTNSPKA
jgi:ATP-dependent exoDNAse (exonuclease V) beta subunit